jgi:hypothetical protein
MGFVEGDANAPRHGFLFVVGMPNSTGSIRFDIDRHLCLARLQSACPPVAKPPHRQDGFLAGMFPIYSMSDRGVGQKSSLLRRLVAKFELVDAGSFWHEEDFPMIRESALLPDDDELDRRLMDEFGPDGPSSLYRRARDI